MCNGVLKPCGKGCAECPPNSPGTDGSDGLSAYDIWIGEGNVGTEQDFLDSLVGADGADGADGVPYAKVNFYAEFSNQISVSTGLPDPTVYHHPVGYGVLTYTNSTGSTKDFIVHGSFDTVTSASNNDDFSNWVDGAIIKTVSAIDSVMWEHLGDIDARGSLYDGATSSDSINIATTNKLLSADLSPVEFRFGSVKIPKNVSFFKKVTLNDGETISLKFKTKDSGADSLLNKAQIFVLEID